MGLYKVSVVVFYQLSQKDRLVDLLHIYFATPERQKFQILHSIDDLLFALLIRMLRLRILGGFNRPKTAFLTDPLLKFIRIQRFPSVRDVDSQCVAQFSWAT